MHNYQNKKNYGKKNQRTLPELLIIGIGKVLWWLITLPFNKGKKKSDISQADKIYVEGKVSEIRTMLGSNNVYELKHAVVEADKLVDYILQIKGYNGATFADRLKNAEEYMDQSTYQRLWDGHKIRNMIAHENAHISESEIKEAVLNLLRYTNV